MKESNKEKSDATKSIRERNKGDSLAKRIEDEIQSARAFAEKKYYSGDNKDVFGTPKEGPSHLTRSKGSNRSTATVHSVDTDVTQLISNLSPTNATGNTGDGTPMSNRDIHHDMAKLLTPKTSLPVDHPTST